MSKAKHLQAILRSQQQQLLLQFHNPVTVAVAPTAGSLRLLSSRLVLGPGLESGSSSIHSLTHSRQPLQQQQQQQQEPQHHCHHLRSGHQASRVCRRDLPRGSSTATTATAAAAGACRFLHTSARAYSFASPPSASATATASSSSSAKGNGDHASESLSTSSAGDYPGSQSAHVFAEQTSSTAARWTSELPWIDPHTGASYEPGKAPSRSGNKGGAGTETGTETRTGNINSSASTSFFHQPFQKTRHHYVFAHGASGFPKNPGKAPTLTPEEDRAYFSVQVGEDAYFRRHDALGVADGVGGWCGTTGKFLCKHETL